jgi:Ca2+-binding EF-hand superfamily protein
MLTSLGFALVTALSGLAIAQPGPGGNCGFRRADLNNDGKVTLDEALTHGKQMFQLRDKNKDGVITRDEVPGWGGRFAQADTNNDGKVTYAEHEAMLRARFTLMDKNKDGVLSGDELACGQRGGRGRNCQ